MKAIFFSAFLCLVTLSGCAVAPLPLTTNFLPERGEFISPNGERMSFHQALQLAASAEYVIIGEGHSNQCDHLMQQRLVRGLVELGHAPALGLEMIPVSLQATLDRFLAGEIAAENLGKELDWKENWGYPYELFKPLLAMAEQRGLPVAGLNAPKKVVRKASREGVAGFTDAERKYYPARVIPHLPEQERELAAVFAMHGEVLDGDARLQRFLLVQAIWDTMMAEQAVALHARTGRPAVLIAGSGHVDRGLGIPRRVRMLDPGARVVTLVPVRDVRWFRSDLGTAAFYCPQSYQSRMRMTLEVRQGRVLVVAVQPGGRAERAGIRPGDELVVAQGRSVQGLMDLHRAGKAAHETNKPLVLGFDRYGERVTVNLGKLGTQRPGKLAMDGKKEKGKR